MLFHTTYFSEFVLWSNIISENLFFFLDLFVHKLIFDKNSWFLLLSLNYSIMYAVGKETSKPETCYCLASMKTFLLLLTKSPNTRNFLPLSALCLCFVFSFSFSGLLRPLPQICRVWLTQTPQKVLTKSP